METLPSLLSPLFKVVALIRLGVFLRREEENMQNARAADVANYILTKKGAMTTMKLQKLLYYCQAWSLVWDEAPLFPESIEAWANGPIVPEIYKMHRGQFSIESISGDSRKLTSIQKETIDAVLAHYGNKTAQWLSELTHREDPWKNARDGLAPGDRGDSEISLASMNEYYSSI